MSGDRDGDRRHGGEVVPPQPDEAGQAPALWVAALALRGDELLMVRLGHAPTAGDWSLPGGALAAGETLAEAVVRLLCDQTGHEDVLCGPFMSWSEAIDDSGRSPHRVTMYFSAVVMDAEPAVAGSAAECAWTPTWRAPELPLSEGLAEFLADQDIIDTVV